MSAGCDRGLRPTRRPILAVPPPVRLQKGVPCGARRSATCRAPSPARRSLAAASASCPALHASCSRSRRTKMSCCSSSRASPKRAAAESSSVRRQHSLSLAGAVALLGEGGPAAHRGDDGERGAATACKRAHRPLLPRARSRRLAPHASTRLRERARCGAGATAPRRAVRPVPGPPRESHKLVVSPCRAEELPCRCTSGLRSRSSRSPRRGYGARYVRRADRDRQPARRLRRRHQRRLRTEAHPRRQRRDPRGCRSGGAGLPRCSTSAASASAPGASSRPTLATLASGD